MDAEAWNSRYRDAELLWGAQPNTFVVAELTAAPPGRALDVACGEGRNAIWLASHGWQVIGVDFSAVGLERAEQLASRAGVEQRVSFRLADVVSDPLPTGPFDAVIVAYLQLAPGPRRVVLRKAAAAVGTGGTLLVVGHDSTNLAEGIGGPQDPAVLFSPAEVLADLAGLDGLVVEKAERVRRPVPGAERDAIDALVRLRREPQPKRSRRRPTG
ncbi:MAG: class I SAM-dependent methyltransferase [Mycobacterium sp.]|uniref:class I SAM-dependent methyltransferase n=1 Tax=Mycobacterium sp. TaxID=1785 RepID=UPI0026053163|nr:class I SAM-dependent methyltransferase [Mycobacterium sp.]MDI3315255.1 class I SAM-dependent methyltransferase [Mycobacterium sp.]